MQFVVFIIIIIIKENKNVNLYQGLCSPLRRHIGSGTAKTRQYINWSLDCLILG
jgi:hypothetical protein